MAKINGDNIEKLQNKITALIEKDMKGLSPMDIMLALEGVKFFYTARVVEIINTQKFKN